MSSRALTIQKLYGGELAPVSKVVALLAKETNAKRVADFVKAVEAARMIDGNNQDRSNYWGALGIWSTKRLGQLIREGQEAGRIATAKTGRPKKGCHDGTLSLQEVLQTKTAAEAKHISSRAKKVDALPEKTIKAYLARQKESNEEISKAGLLRAAGADGTICTKHGNDVIDWYTPEKYVESVRKVLGTIDLDPASSAHAQKIVQAGAYYTAQSDGLSKGWAGTVYLNPPYKMPLVAQFTQKLCDEFAEKRVTAAILLTNDNTDTTWWHQAATASSSICFHRGRISFYNTAGESSSPTNGQTFFYFGRATARFAKVFGGFGLCLKR